MLIPKRVWKHGIMFNALELCFKMPDKKRDAWTTNINAGRIKKLPIKQETQTSFKGNFCLNKLYMILTKL